MGLWKDVAMDVQRGCPENLAWQLNIKLRNSKTPEERRAIEAKIDREIKLNQRI